jgi:hypothetical protein
MSDSAIFEIRGEEPTCPRCKEVMPAGETTCPTCGHCQDAQPAVIEPLTRHWEAGLPTARRVAIFMIGQGIGLTMLVIAAFIGELLAALVSWLIFTGMLVFIVGTYDCVNLTRNQKGRVALTRSWRVCFVPRPPIKLRLSEYDGIGTGMDRDADMWDWLLVLVLLSFGLIPGIIGWYWMIHCDKFFVALVRGHGAPAYFLYRGTSEAHMHDMAATIREVAFAI